jgi:hypothetical protein
LVCILPEYLRNRNQELISTSRAATVSSSFSTACSVLGASTLDPFPVRAPGALNSILGSGLLACFYSKIESLGYPFLFLFLFQKFLFFPGLDWPSVFLPPTWACTTTVSYQPLPRTQPHHVKQRSSETGEYRPFFSTTTASSNSLLYSFLPRSPNSTSPHSLVCLFLWPPASSNYPLTSETLPCVLSLLALATPVYTSVRFTPSSELPPILM